MIKKAKNALQKNKNFVRNSRLLGTSMIKSQYMIKSEYEMRNGKFTAISHFLCLLELPFPKVYFME